MKKDIWVVTANSSKAIILHTENNLTLSEVDTLHHPSSRLKDSEITSDGPGSTFDRAGPGRHKMEPKTSPHDHEVELFAREVADYIEKLPLKDGTTKIYLVASPDFLGVLRKKLSPNMTKHVVGEVNKDLSGQTPEKMREQLPLVL